LIDGLFDAYEYLFQLMESVEAQLQGLLGEFLRAER
jgi:hypothetical protein